MRIEYCHGHIDEVDHEIIYLSYREHCRSRITFHVATSIDMAPILVRASLI